MNMPATESRKQAIESSNHRLLERSAAEAVACKLKIVQPTLLHILGALKNVKFWADHFLENRFGRLGIHQYNKVHGDASLSLPTLLIFGNLLCVVWLAGEYPCNEFHPDELLILIPRA